MPLADDAPAYPLPCECCGCALCDCPNVPTFHYKVQVSSVTVHCPPDEVIIFDPPLCVEFWTEPPGCEFDSGAQAESEPFTVCGSGGNVAILSATPNCIDGVPTLAYRLTIGAAELNANPSIAVPGCDPTDLLGTFPGTSPGLALDGDFVVSDGTC